MENRGKLHESSDVQQSVDTYEGVVPVVGILVYPSSKLHENVTDEECKVILGDVKLVVCRLKHTIFNGVTMYCLCVLFFYVLLCIVFIISEISLLYISMLWLPLSSIILV